MDLHGDDEDDCPIFNNHNFTYDSGVHRSKRLKLRQFRMKKSRPTLDLSGSSSKDQLEKIYSPYFEKLKNLSPSLIET